MWRHIAGSVRGASHERGGEPCQDTHVAAVIESAWGPGMVACVADGAGSASNSQHGSQIACDAISDKARRHFEREGGFQLVSRDDAIVWCDHARMEIARRAEADGKQPRDYACTLSVALLSERGTAFFQIGDGAIVARQGGVYGVVFWPQSGEYANSTNFLTQDGYEDRLEFLSSPATFGEVALFTDGLERLALSFEGQTAHAPFFDPLLQAVRQTNDLEGLNQGLQGFLTSEVVQNRSDDDKTLVLAAKNPG